MHKISTAVFGAGLHVWIGFAACLTAHAADFKREIIYQIVTDRFFDGDPGNNDPPQSRGLYDPEKKNFQAYWGGDLLGIQKAVIPGRYGCDCYLDFATSR